jgi:hypothetical protein
MSLLNLATSALALLALAQVSSAFVKALVRTRSTLLMRPVRSAKKKSKPAPKPV